jgi:Divergent InlB B-repeat domain
MGAAVLSKRVALAGAGVLVAVSCLAAAAPSASSVAVLNAVTAGPGTIIITPGADGKPARCKIIVQQEDPEGSACVQQYKPGKRVKLQAVPDDGKDFEGWGDFGCTLKNPTCTIMLGDGPHFVTAQFGPVSLTIDVGSYAPITVSPLGETCTGDLLTQCVYPDVQRGTTITLRRGNTSAHDSWIGPCKGRTRLDQNGDPLNALDADACTFRIQGDEEVAAGFDAEAAVIPPPLGTTLVVKRGGKGRGTITGQMVGDTSKRLRCGRVCTMPALTRYDQVRLQAVPAPGSCLYRWSDALRIPKRTIDLESTPRLRATFVKRRRAAASAHAARALAAAHRPRSGTSRALFCR